MRPSLPLSARGAASRLRMLIRWPAAAGSAALVAASPVAAQGTNAGVVASAVPVPAAPIPASPGVSASAFRIVDVGADGRERGWLTAEVQPVSAGVAVTVSHSGLRMSSPNARILGVRAVLVDADTARGWRVRAVSAPMRSTALVGCVDGRLAAPARFLIPASPSALRDARLAFELVGQVRAPGSRRWDQVAERWLPGPVLASAASTADGRR